MSFFQLLLAIPDLVKLYKLLDAAAKTYEDKRKAADEVKNLHAAIAEKDSKKVDHLFV